MARNKIVIAGLLAAVFFMAACQAAKTRQLYIDSQPQGAIVLMDGEAIGQTPMTRNIKFKDKKERHMIQVKKEGYKPMQRYIQSRDAENQMFQMEK